MLATFSAFTPRTTKATAQQTLRELDDHVICDRLIFLRDAAAGAGRRCRRRPCICGRPIRVAAADIARAAGQASSVARVDRAGARRQAAGISGADRRLRLDERLSGWGTSGS